MLAITNSGPREPFSLCLLSLNYRGVKIITATRHRVAQYHRTAHLSQSLNKSLWILVPLQTVFMLQITNLSFFVLYLKCCIKKNVEGKHG